MGGMGGVIGGFSQRQKACLLHSLNTMASSTVQYNSNMLLISATPIKFTTPPMAVEEPMVRLISCKAQHQNVVLQSGFRENFTHKRLILCVSEN
jgi:hypothetical protein